MAAAFKDGSVRRIKLVNFMTYRSIEFHPGPKLNLVVGPNGTGKSSLVSALCLGLAGKPTLLGKAEKIGQFVKQGEDVASVEIELVRGEEAVVVRRDLTAAGSSSWSVGGAAASQRHVEDLVASLGIQLHSLGQFLPQEKVGDFAKLSRAERLALMQRSLPSGELLSLHETLTQLQQQRHSLQSTLSSKTSHLEKLQQRQEAQASAIYKFRQWERHNQHITWLTRKRAWVEYEVEVTLYHEVKSRASQALAEKRRLVQAAEPLARTQRDAQQRWHDATHARSHTEKEMAEKVKEIQSLEEILERHSDKVEEEKQTVSRRLADDKDRVTRIQAAVRIIDGWQEELRSLDADQRGSGEGGSGEGVGDGGAGVGEAALKAVSEELAGLGVRTAGMSAERHIVTSRLASLQQDLQRAEARLSRIQDSASRVLERLRSQFPDAVSASLWLAENRDRFSGDIQGPLAITLSPRDEQAACLLENHVSKNDLKTFIFQIDADMETFLTLMRDGKNLRVNAVRAPDKSADEYVPVVPLATITQPLYGFVSYLREVFTAPPLVMSFLCENYRVHTVPVGTHATRHNIEKVMSDLPLKQFYTPDSQYRVRQSLYSGESLVSSSCLRPPRLLASSSVAGGDEEDERTHLVTHIQSLRGEETELRDRAETLSLGLRDAALRDNQLREAKRRHAETRRRRLTLANNIRTKTDSVRAMQGCEQGRAADEAASKRRMSEALTHSDTTLQNYTHSLQELVRLCEESVRLSLRSEALHHQHRHATSSLGQANDDIQAAAEERERVRGEKERRLTECKALLHRAKELSGLGPDQDTPPDVKEALLSCPDTVEELDDAISEAQARASLLSVNPTVLRECEVREEEIHKTEAEVAALSQTLAEVSANISSTKPRWLCPLRAVVCDLNARFSRYCCSVGCAGELDLFTDDEDDFAGYGLRVRVKFRAEGLLQEVTPHEQSGGERSVSTLLCVMALYCVTRRPLLVIDEINQGMDASNERKVFDVVTDAACHSSSGQSFLITPKLLHGLTYHEDITVHFIFNGPGIAAAAGPTAPTALKDALLKYYKR